MFIADAEDRKLGLVCPECGKGYLASCVVSGWNKYWGNWSMAVRQCKLCGHQKDMGAEDV
jgi:transcription elongation factor Elf1